MARTFTTEELDEIMRKTMMYSDTTSKLIGDLASALMEKIEELKTVRFKRYDHDA